MCLGPRTQPHPPEAPARPRGRPRGRQMSQLRQWPLPGGKQQSAPALSLGRMACGLSAASGPGALPGAPLPRSGLGAEMKQLKTGFGDKGGVSSCGGRARMGSARQGCSFIVDSRTPQRPDPAPPPPPKYKGNSREGRSRDIPLCRTEGPWSASPNLAHGHVRIRKQRAHRRRVASPLPTQSR